MNKLHAIIVALFGKVFARGVCRVGHYVEHAGFVALAGAEVASAHALIFWISWVLLGSGIFALMYDKISGE